MHRPMRSVLVSVAAGTLAASAALPQSVISARAGLIHYAQGRVYLAGETVQPKFGQFPQMKENQELRTEAGRAEVLLNPGVFLRVGEDSSVRMLDTRIVSARLEFVSGKILIEAANREKDSAVTIVHKDATVSLGKAGLYRLNAEPAELRVLDGEATVEAGGQRLVVGKGRLLPLDGSMAVRKFDREQTDAFDRWSSRRAEQVAMANVYAARSIQRSQALWSTSGWYWNPYFGMFTFVPVNGIYGSPYGYQYWSPREIYMVYEPPRAAPPMAASGYYDANRGYTVMRPTSSGTSGVLASGASAPTTSSSSTSAPITRETGQAGGRSR